MANISAIKLPDGVTYDIVDRVSKNVWYGTCSTSSSIQQKAVTTLSGDFTLDEGNILLVEFASSNSYDGATLSVDELTAKAIYVNGSPTNDHRWRAGEVVIFVYDGYHFNLIEQGMATTSYYGITKLSSSTSSTSELIAATPKAVKVAYDEATDATATPTASKKSKFDSDAHMNSTDMTTQALETYVDSLDIQGSVFVDATDVPIAGEIAKFDSTANMSSTDMTTGSGSEVEAFVNGLNVSNSMSIFPVRVFDSIAPYNCTTANTMQYTGVNVTIPANSFFAISARATYNGAKPLNVAINDSSTNANANVATGAYSDVMCTCSYISFTSTQKTFYLWAKYATVNTSAGSLYIDGWYIKQ